MAAVLVDDDAGALDDNGALACLRTIHVAFVVRFFAGRTSTRAATFRRPRASPGGGGGRCSEGAGPWLPGSARAGLPSSTCRRCPSPAAMLASASTEKRESRPHGRSLMRGCVTPQRLAASVWVQPFRS